MKEIAIVLAAFFPLMSFGQTDSLVTEKDTLVAVKDSIYKSVDIEGVVVTAGMVTHHADHDSWIITEELRKNTVNTFDVIKKLPGVYFDPIKESLSYYESEKVLLLIDGQEKSSSYIGHLSNKRFKRIEVYTRPPARYRDYDIVIDVRTKERWKGFDFSVPVRLWWNPSQPSEDKLAECATGFSYTYTTPVFNIATWYDYGHRNVVTATETDFTIANTINMRNEDGENVKGSMTNGHTVFALVDYKPDVSNTLTWVGRFKSDNANGRSYNRYRRWIGHDEPSLASQSLIGDGQSEDYLSRLAYKGNFRKWKVDGSALYGFFHDDRIHATLVDGMSSYMSRHKIRRNMFSFKSSATYNVSESDEMEFGIEEHLQWVNVGNGIEGEISENDRRQTKTFASYSHSFGKSLTLSSSVEYNHTYNKASQGINFKENFLNYAFELSYIPGKDLRIKAFYTNRITLPQLYQRIDMSGQTDTLLFFSGNPELRAARVERWFASINAGPAYLATSYVHTNNKIVSFFDFSNPNVIQTYKNALSREYELVMGFFPKPLQWKNNSLSFRSIAFYHWKKVKLEGFVNKCSYWTGYGTILLDNEKLGGLNLTYCKQNNRDLMPQGEILMYDNSWSLSAWHLFAKQNITLSLLYILPVSWGVEKSSFQKFSTPYYAYNQSILEYQRMKNSVLVTATFHLAKGRKVRRTQQLGGEENGTLEIYH